MCANYAFRTSSHEEKKTGTDEKYFTPRTLPFFFFLQRRIVDLAFGVFRKRKPVNFASETSKLRVLSFVFEKHSDTPTYFDAE